jgi:hypothetical protein
MKALLSQLAPIGCDRNDVVSAAERTMAAFEVEANKLVGWDESMAERARLTSRRQSFEHLLSAIHKGIVGRTCEQTGYLVVDDSEAQQIVGFHG